MGGRDRHLQQRHPRDRRRLHRSRRRRPQHPRDAQPRRQRRAHRAERAADLRRPRVLHPQRRLQHAGRAEVQQPGRRDRVSQHDHRGEPHGAAGVERALRRTTCSWAPMRRSGIAVLGGPTAYSTYDYNGYRPNRGAEFAVLVARSEAGHAGRLRPAAEPGASDSRRSRSWPPPPVRRRTASRWTTTSSRACVRRRRRIRRSPARRTTRADLNFRLKPGEQSRGRGRASAERERRRSPEKRRTSAPTKWVSGARLRTALAEAGAVLPVRRSGRAHREVRRSGETLTGRSGDRNARRGTKVPRYVLQLVM